MAQITRLTTDVVQACQPSDSATTESTMCPPSMSALSARSGKMNAALCPALLVMQVYHVSILSYCLKNLSFRLRICRPLHLSGLPVEASFMIASDETFIQAYRAVVLAVDIPTRRKEASPLAFACMSVGLPRKSKLSARHGAAGFRMEIHAHRA